MNKEQVLKEHYTRKTIFLFLQIIAIICLFKNCLEGAICATLVIVILVGIWLFKLIEQLNYERGIE